MKNFDQGLFYVKVSEFCRLKMCKNAYTAQEYYWNMLKYSHTIQRNMFQVYAKNVHMVLKCSLSRNVPKEFSLNSLISSPFEVARNIPQNMHHTFNSAYLRSNVNNCLLGVQG